MTFPSISIDPFPVNVSSLSGHTSQFFVRRSELVADLKERIALAQGVPILEQRLVFMQNELQNETPINQTGLETGSTLHLVLVAPTGSSQPTSYFSSSVSPSLSVTHFRLGLGLEQLLPVGQSSLHLRPPHLPLPPHLCHIVHMHDVPSPAWKVFVYYLYCRQLSEQGRLKF